MTDEFVHTRINRATGNVPTISLSVSLVGKGSLLERLLLLDSKFQFHVSLFRWRRDGQSMISNDFLIAFKRALSLCACRLDCLLTIDASAALDTRKKKKKLKNNNGNLITLGHSRVIYF